MKARKISIGDKFGNFEVISEPFIDGKYRKVNCKCKCGKIKKVHCSSVNKLKKCKKCTANDQRKYKINQTINCFTILEYKYDKIKNCSSYVVQCNCGSKPYEMSSWELGKTKNCKSCFQPLGNKHPSYKGTTNISKTYFSQILLGAKSRNLEFSISIEDMENQLILQDNKCKFTKLPIKIGNEKEEGTASLDRIDSNLGYTKENIQWVHKDINRMKTDFNQTYFLELCSLVVNNFM